MKTKRRAKNAPLYALHAGPLPAATLVLRILLYDWSTWEVPARAVLKEAYRYYTEEEGWYEDEEDARERGGREDGSQPRGKELRDILEANLDYDSFIKECYWSDLRHRARHVAGPPTEPTPGRLWAVEEAGGDFVLLTTLPPEEQYREGYGWRDVLDPEHPERTPPDKGFVPWDRAEL